MRRIFFAVLFLAVASMWPEAARAEYWTVNGAGCVPESGTIQGAEYAVVSGAVTTIVGQVNSTYFTCPVRENSGDSNPTVLAASFHTCSNSGVSFGDVYGTLWRKSRSTGSLLSVASFASADVNCATGGDGTAVGFSHTLDFDSYFYYVYVGVEPSLYDDTIVFRGVGLD